MNFLENYEGHPEGERNTDSEQFQMNTGAA
ncbi:Uncharacterised protein [Salmonella enterica subsp. enterica]|uniref:Uncharacterized protein n=1 Tax=Salmonella enterica I TaxID=59201 RepID=A0A379Y229_SALET|nr:Uncharacterised protein [Salmonella enterica subsp. enterica]